jgi:Ran GTPase-activating protein (RanGAP) involved in mRNA processing and transport
MRLDMSHCDLGNDLDTLSVILQLYVEEICLSHNNIDSRGAVKISEYLGRNPPLKSLNLHDNSFNDDDAILLSRSLKENTHLRRLRREGFVCYTL